jgi:hypothetical protein
LMRWRVRSIWWDDVIKFDESFSSDLMKWRFHSSSLMNRFRQIWWIVFFKFDEMFRQAWRLIINVVRQIENKHTSLDNRKWACVIRQKWDLTNQKNWRWDDQTWSREYIISNNFCKKQIWIAFLKSYFTFKDKTQNTLSTYFRKQLVLTFIAIMNLRWNFIKSCKKKRLLRAKKAYNCHVLEEKQFINKTFIFIHYRLFSQKYEHDTIFSWNQTFKSIHFMRFLLYSSRLYRCTSKKSRARFWL